MHTTNERTSPFKATLSVAQNLGLLTLGSLGWVLGMTMVLIPNHLFSGGLVGISLVAKQWFPALDLGLACFVLNIPLFILGWARLSRAFFLYSLFGAAAFSLMASCCSFPAVVFPHPLVAALVGGLLCGFSSAVILESAGCAGGLDILAIYISLGGKKVGSLIIAINGVILLCGITVFGLAEIFYSLIFIATQGLVINTLHQTKKINFRQLNPYQRSTT